MIDRIKKFLKEKISYPGELKDEENTIRIAAAILFVEVMHADHIVDSRERELVNNIMQRTFNLSEQESLELLGAAEDIIKNAVSLHEYTSILNANLEHREKLDLVENIWRIILADDAIDRYEEHLVRKISELLYLRQSEFIKAKLNVTKKP